MVCQIGALSGDGQSIQAKIYGKNVNLTFRMNGKNVSQKVDRVKDEIFEKLQDYLENISANRRFKAFHIHRNGYTFGSETGSHRRNKKLEDIYQRMLAIVKGVLKEHRRSRVLPGRMDKYQEGLIRSSGSESPSSEELELDAKSPGKSRRSPRRSPGDSYKSDESVADRRVSALRAALAREEAGEKRGRARRVPISPKLPPMQDGGFSTPRSPRRNPQDTAVLEEMRVLNEKLRALQEENVAIKEKLRSAGSAGETRIFLREVPPEGGGEQAP